MGRSLQPSPGPARLIRLDDAGQPVGEPIEIALTKLDLATCTPWWRRLWARFMDRWPGQRIICVDPPGIPPRRVELEMHLGPEALKAWSVIAGTGEVETGG